MQSLKFFVELNLSIHNRPVEQKPHVSYTYMIILSVCIVCYICVWYLVFY